MKQICRLFIVVSFLFNVVSAVVAQTMYWTDAGTGKIQRANLDGSNVEDLVTQAQRFGSYPRGIALDVAGAKMYWTDAERRKIQRSNLDGSNVEDLVTRAQGLSIPLGIALDVAGAKMYWTDNGTDKIQRANLDGSGIEDLVTTGLSTPYGIAIGIPPQLMATAQPVNIPDRNLRAKIEAALGKASGAAITTADMAALTQLDAPNANIRNLNGLEHAVNLTSLNLEAEWVEAEWKWINSNSISNISVLSRLTNLKWLNLSRTNISDISPLSGLTNLIYLNLSNNNITNISAVSGLTNLTGLWLHHNSISDISPVRGLTNLTHLSFENNPISDISVLSGLTNLEVLYLIAINISDISAVSGLTKLTLLHLAGNNISDLSPLVSNTGLGSGDKVYVMANPLNTTAINTHIPTLQRRGVTVEFDAPRPVNIPDQNLRAKVEEALGKASGATITTADMATLTGLLEAQNLNIRNLTGLEHATNLTWLLLNVNHISNISAVSGLTNLTSLGLSSNSISDISAVSGLTNLTTLHLGNNLSISDLSVLSGLTNLRSLYLNNNNISDLSVLSGLTNLTLLQLAGNSISDISALVSNTGLGSGDKVFLTANPLNTAAFNTHIPTLQRRAVTVDFDPPRPVNIPDRNLRAKVEEALGKASGAAITTADMAALTQLDAPNANIRNLNGLEHATNLTSLMLNANHISDISAVSGLTNLTSLYLNNNNISDLSPLVSNRGLGSGDTVEVKGNPLSAVSINTHIPTLQRRGVKVEFDKAPSTNATVSVFPSPVESPGVGGQLTVSLKVENGVNVAGYQATVAFDTSVLRYKESTNGDYLPTGAFFVPPAESGNQVTLAATALSGESNGNGTLAILMFEVVVVKSSTLTLSDVVLSDGAGVGFQPQITNGEIVEPRGVNGDVNGDGVVNIQDLVLAAQRLGQRGQNDADMNGDGVVNIQDLVLVAGAFGNTAAAPALAPQALTMFTTADVQDWLTEAEQLGLTTPAHRRGIAVLKHLLSVLTPKETALLPNYPNPFNPETWIPYRLAHAADVQVIIHDIKGAVVRRLDLGHQPAGYYTDRTKSAYWDGRNANGESVVSGVYFYTLTVRSPDSIGTPTSREQAGETRADNFTATRQMLILK